MTHALTQFSTLVAKDLRIEARSRQTLGLVLVMGVLVVASIAGVGATVIPVRRAVHVDPCAALKGEG